ncbi:6777_t:CDS:2 [Diversispora eburnea]|uniref:6777_t:CDS:1 n=1 Tax=Diversispora eburnea TaxID=1213867 RepID=A0A9N9AZ17_9GLOM|nr:6777_t:CDS:2 [Diversispora eburnea]
MPPVEQLPWNWILIYHKQSLEFLLGCVLGFILGEIFTLLNSIVTSKIHHNIIVDFPPSSFPSLQASVIIFCIHTPFSMYSAITFSNVFYNGFIAFTDMNDQYFIVASVCAWFLTVIGLTWALTGIMSKGRRDGVFSATIAWELLAIATQQREFEFFSIQCFVLAIVIFVTILVVWIRLGGELTEVIRQQNNITIISEQHDPLLQQENEE